MYIQRIIVLVSLLLLAACGGGGGGSVPPPPSTVVSGVASKGIISDGTVTVYSLKNDGSKGTMLGQDTTKTDGTYSVNIGTYTGPVTVEVSGGSYMDEATGFPQTISATAPLRAAISNASGNVTVAVTPLTDLAVRQAGTLTAQNITTANSLISDTFKVDVISTTPVAPTAAAFQANETTQAQKDYTLALAAMSQQMQTAGTDLSTTLSSLNSGISSAGMNVQTATAITTAVTNFIASANNLTGVSTIADTSLQSVGATSMKLTVALQGNAVPSVRGVQTTISLPAGATLRADTTSKVLSGVITSASNVPVGSIDGKYTAAVNGTPASVTIGYITSGSLIVGDILILNLDLATGVTMPLASAFTISGSKLVDSDGKSISGVLLSVR